MAMITMTAVTMITMTTITDNNTTNKTVNFGLTSEDEMNIIFGYYY